MRLPATERAASAARSFVRAVLVEQGAASAPGADGGPAAGRAGSGFADEAVLLASELVTSAAASAGTDIEVVCRVESPAVPAGAAGLGGGEPAPPANLVVEVVDRTPAGTARGSGSPIHDVRGYGRQLLHALSESWGVTHRGSTVAVWFRLGSAVETGPAGPVRPWRAAVAPVQPPAGNGSGTYGDGGGGLPETAAAGSAGPAGGPGATPDGAGAGRDERADRSAEPGEEAGATRADGVRHEPEGTSFLAEASELLAGQLDEDMVAVVASQLLVPRIADWCGVWLTTERGGMRLARVWHTSEQHIDALRHVLEQEQPPSRLTTTPIPWPWPEDSEAVGTGGSALAFPLVAGGRCHGAVLLGRAGRSQISRGSARTAEDVMRRVAQAVVTARHFARQAAISRTLQRRQLPESLAYIPGVETAIIYEPYGEGQTVGGDFYDVFPIGERRWSFLLGDVSGHDLEAMSSTGLARHLVRLLAREGHGIASLLGRLNEAMAEESAEAMAIEGEQAGQRFLSLLYGELEPDTETGTVHCSVASAGHPLPLRLSTDGTVAPMADSQMLLGIDEQARFHADSFELSPGDILLCVTDGVTERRHGDRQLDDEDGLAEVLRGCAGLGAKAVADRIRQTAHDFGTGPIDDDLAILVLEAAPVPGRGRG